MNTKNGKLSKAGNMRNTSGCKGIYYYEKTKRWRAVITHNKKCIYLGLFKTKEEAITARKEAAKEHFGEFANEG